MDIKKLEVKEVIPKFDGDKILVSTEDGDIDVIESLKHLTQKHNLLNIKITKASNRKQVERKPNFKFTCNCGKIVTQDEEFSAHCNKCGEDFKIN